MLKTCEMTKKSGLTSPKIILEWSFMKRVIGIFKTSKRHDVTVRDSSINRLLRGVAKTKPTVLEKSSFCKTMVFLKRICCYHGGLSLQRSLEIGGFQLLRFPKKNYSIKFAWFKNEYWFCHNFVICFCIYIAIKFLMLIVLWYTWDLAVSSTDRVLTGSLHLS